MKKNNELIVEAEIVEIEPIERDPEFKIIPRTENRPKPLQVGEIIHVRVQHNSNGVSCHAAIVTDITRNYPNVWVLPCGACNAVPKRIQLIDIQWHRLEDCKR